MLRARLATSLLFNVLLALWVLYDARIRGGRKPLFAAALTLLWGPLGLGLWASDRPLAPGERRGSTSATIGHTFLLAWTALAPAAYVLIVPEMANRAAVPGSFAWRLGPFTASAVVALAIWGGPALVALFLGRGHGSFSEQGRGAVRPGAIGLRWAVGAAGALALGFALLLTR